MKKEEEVTEIDKHGNVSVINISYKIRLIDSARFIASLRSNLVHNLTDGIHKNKCKNCDCSFEYKSAKDNLIKYKCLSCNKDYSNKIDEEVKKRFKSTCKFANNDINKFILFLNKDFYPHE